MNATSNTVVTVAEALLKAEKVRGQALEVMLSPNLSMKQLVEAGQIVDELNEFIRANSHTNGGSNR
jgi:hypothetical protein